MSEENTPTELVVTTESKTVGTDANIEDIEAHVAKLAEERAKVLAAAMTEQTVKGLKAKNAEVLGELKKVKARPTLTQEQFADYTQIKQRISRDELLALMAQGKSEQALAIATRKTRAQADAALMVAREEKERVSLELAALRTETEGAKISAAISQAAASSVKPQYTGLIQKLVKDQIKVIDGQTRVVDSEGNVKVGSKGQPLTVADLIDSFKPDMTDLFHSPSGGGSQGSNQAGKGTTTLANTPQQRVGQMTMQEYKAWRNSRRRN